MLLRNIEVAAFPALRLHREGRWPRRTGSAIYALRQSNIVRQLLAGVPVRIVAVNHDTSIVMIERTYSRHIGD